MARKTGTFWKLSIIWNKYFGDSHWNWMNATQDVCLQLSLKDHTRINKLTTILDAKIWNKIWEFLGTKFMFWSTWLILQYLTVIIVNPYVKRDGMTWKIHVLTRKFESRWCRLELSTVLKDNNDGLLWMHSLSFVYCCFAVHTWYILPCYPEQLPYCYIYLTHVVCWS